MEQAVDENGCTFLIASPEKAMVDKLQSERRLPIRSQKALAHYLSDNLRIEMSSVIQMDDSKIAGCGIGYNSGKTAILVKLIQRMRKNSNVSPGIIRSAASSKCARIVFGSSVLEKCTCRSRRFSRSILTKLSNSFARAFATSQVFPTCRAPHFSNEFQLNFGENTFMVR